MTGTGGVLIPGVYRLKTLALGLVVAFWLAPRHLLAQANPDEPRKPVSAPQPFAPIINESNDLRSNRDKVDPYSPWMNAMDDLRLPGDFDPTEVDWTGLVEEPKVPTGEVPEMSRAQRTLPFYDLIVDDSGGTMLTTPGESAFLNVNQLEKLPYGGYTYPMVYVPTSALVFERPRKLTQVGPVRIGADLTGSIAYNDNVFGATTGQKGDFISGLQPAFYLEAGTKGNIRLTYAPNIINYAKYKDLNSVNQAFLLRARYPFTKLKLGADIFYFSQSGLFLNSIGTAEQKSFVARLNATYPVTRKIAAGIAGESVTQMSTPGGNSIENSIELTGGYQLTKSTVIGGSVKLATYTAPADDQTYQTIKLNAAWRATTNLQFLAEAGIQLRRLSFSTEGKDMLSIPVCNFQVNYNPSSTTAFNLVFYRNVLNTTFNDVSLEIQTGVKGSMLLRLYEKVNVSFEMGAGYTEQLSAEQENDGHFYYAQAQFTASYAIWKTVEFQIFDNVQKRFGDSLGANYVSNTSGVALTLKF